MNAARSPVIAVSSWSLHRTVGLTWWDSPARPGQRKEAYGPGTIALLDLPAAIARHGITRMQLGHFHVERRDKGWFAEFRAAVKAAGVTLTCLLIDEGDISDAASHARDIAWIGGWVDTAAALGATSARVVAGKQKPTAETLALSVAGLKEIARRGKSQGVRVITENWFDLLAGPKEVNHIMNGVGEDLGLLADFGNWKGPAKYAQLAEILPRSEETHAKCSFSGPLSAAGSMDIGDYGRCVDIAADAGYDGPYTLVYDGPDDDEWAGIAAEEKFVRDRLAARAARRRTA